MEQVIIYAMCNMICTRTLDGLNGNESNPFNTSISDSPRLHVNNNATYEGPDPPHSLEGKLICNIIYIGADVTHQVFGSQNFSANPPPMNGFVENTEFYEEGM